MAKKKQKLKDLTAEWNERNYKYRDVIVSSGEIRRLFFTRCKELKLDPYTVAMKVGFKPTIFKKYYVDCHEPVCTKSFDQVRFIEMIELVGIDIKVLIKLKPFSEVYVRLQETGIIK